MLKSIASYLQSNKLMHASFILFVLLALTPCTVKEAAADVLGTSYERPLQKNRTAVYEEGDCEHGLEVAVQQIQTSRIDFSSSLDFEQPSVDCEAELSSIIIGDSHERRHLSQVPIYILLRRMRVPILG